MKVYQVKKVSKEETERRLVEAIDLLADSTVETLTKNLAEQVKANPVAGRSYRTSIVFEVNYGFLKDFVTLCESTWLKENLNWCDRTHLTENGNLRFLRNNEHYTSIWVDISDSEIKFSQYGQYLIDRVKEKLTMQTITLHCELSGQGFFALRFSLTAQFIL